MPLVVVDLDANPRTLLCAVLPPTVPHTVLYRSLTVLRTVGYGTEEDTVCTEAVPRPVLGHF